MTNKRIELFFDILAFFAALVYFVVLFLNIDYFKVPHGDIYQYIRDAKQYINLQLPSLIQLHPISPILIATIEPLFLNFEFPYFSAAKFISILAGAGSFIFTYLIIKEKVNPKIALLASVFCFIHPISILTNLDVTNVSLYSFFSIAALYFLDKNKRQFFIFSTLAFFVRVEGILLIFVYILDNFLKNNDRGIKIKKNIVEILKDKKILIFFFLVFIWMTAQTIHNLKNSVPMGNRYLEEISNTPISLKNFVYIFGPVGTLFFPEKFEWWEFNLFNGDSFTFFISWLSVFLSVLFLIKKSTRNYSFYMLLMAVTHSIFPFIEIRYFYLLMGSFFICLVIVTNEFLNELKNKKIIKNLLLIIIFYIGYQYVLFIAKHLETKLLFYRYEGHDLNYDIAKWIENLPENKSYYLVTKEPFLYYGMIENEKESLKTEFSTEIDSLKKIEFKNKTINFINTAKIRKQCEDGKCILEKNSEKNADYFIITDSITDHYNQELWVKENGIELIKDLLLKKECLSEEKYIENFHSYRRILKINDINCFLEKK